MTDKTNETNSSETLPVDEGANKPVTFPLSDREIKIRNEELSVLVEEAYAALKKCEAFADKYHLEFSWSPAYGMGGWYYGDPAEREYPEDGWRSSSASC